MTWSIDEAVLIALATQQGHDLQPWKPFATSAGRAQCVFCERLYSISRRALAARGVVEWDQEGTANRPDQFARCRGKPG
jgi:hypothetical protein